MLRITNIPNRNRGLIMEKLNLLPLVSYDFFDLKNAFNLGLLYCQQYSNVPVKIDSLNLLVAAYDCNDIWIDSNGVKPKELNSASRDAFDLFLSEISPMTDKCKPHMINLERVIKFRNSL
jgi:hypothetical protein